MFLLLTVVVTVLVMILNYQPAIGCGSKNGEIVCYGSCDSVDSLKQKGDFLYAPFIFSMHSL